MAKTRKQWRTGITAVTERKKCQQSTVSCDVYWVSRFILTLSAPLQKRLEPQPLPTTLSFYNLFSRYLHFQRSEASKGSLGNWEVPLSSSNSGQYCSTAEHRLRLKQYRWGSQTSFVWVYPFQPQYQLYSSHCTNTFTLQLTGSQSCHFPHLWEWSPSETSST